MKDNEKSSDLSVEEAVPVYDIRYTYADYLLWDDDVRRELIDGVPYLMAGIREYWIIDPKDETLAVHILKDNNYITHVYTSEETVNVHVLEGCIINLSKAFEE